MGKRKSSPRLATTPSLLMLSFISMAIFSFVIHRFFKIGSRKLPQHLSYDKIIAKKRNLEKQW